MWDIRWLFVRGAGGEDPAAAVAAAEGRAAAAERRADALDAELARCQRQVTDDLALIARLETAAAGGTAAAAERRGLRSDLDAARQRIACLEEECALSQRGAIRSQEAERGEREAESRRHQTQLLQKDAEIRRLREDAAAVKLAFAGQQGTPSVGQHVTVVTQFKSNSKNAVFLRAGLQGTVKEVREDGKVLIDFEQLPTMHWVFQRNFEHITFRLPADIEDELERTRAEVGELKRQLQMEAGQRTAEARGKEAAQDKCERLQQLHSEAVERGDRYKEALAEEKARHAAPAASPCAPTSSRGSHPQYTAADNYGGFTGSPCYEWNGNHDGPKTQSGRPDMRYACNRVRR